MPGVAAPRRSAWSAVASMSSMGARFPAESRVLTFGTTFRVCAVCLDEYSVGDRLRVLDACGHCFHAPCIDTWVSRRAACPVCSASVPPPPPPPARVAPNRTAGDARRPPPPRVQLIDLSVHDSWIDWLARLLYRRLPSQDHTSLAYSAN